MFITFAFSELEKVNVSRRDFSQKIQYKEV